MSTFMKSFLASNPTLPQTLTEQLRRSYREKLRNRINEYGRANNLGSSFILGNTILSAYHHEEPVTALNHFIGPLPAAVADDPVVMTLLEDAERYMAESKRVEQCLVTIFGNLYTVQAVRDVLPEDIFSKVLQGVSGLPSRMGIPAYSPDQSEEESKVAIMHYGQNVVNATKTLYETATYFLVQRLL